MKERKKERKKEKKIDRERLTEREIDRERGLRKTFRRQREDLEKNTRMCEADRQTDRRSLDEGSDKRSSTFNPTRICRRNENGEEYLWIQIDRITRHFDTRLNIK